MSDIHSRQRGWDVVPSFVGDQFVDARLFEEIQNHAMIPGDTSWGARNLLHALILAMRPHLVLEFGAKIGAASVVIGSALRANQFGRAFHLEKQTQYYDVLKEFILRAELSNYSFALQMSGTDPALRGMFDREADLIFLDANHDYSGAFGDLIAADGLLSDQGVIVVDDASQHHSVMMCDEDRGGVRKAIADFVRSRQMSAVFLEPPLWLNPCGLAILSRQPADLRS